MSDRHIGQPMPTGRDSDCSFDRRVTGDFVTFSGHPWLRAETGMVEPRAFTDVADDSDIITGAEQLLGSAETMGRERMDRALGIIVSTVAFYDRLFHEGAEEFAKEERVSLEDITLYTRYVRNTGGERI